MCGISKKNVVLVKKWNSLAIVGCPELFSLCFCLVVSGDLLEQAWGAILCLSHVISLRYQLLSLTTKAKNLSLNSGPLFPGASWYSFGDFGVSPHDCGRVPAILVRVISTEEEAERLSNFR